MYLETLHVQGVQQSETVYPRIKLYTTSHLNMLVEADKATQVLGQERCHGVVQL
jgi:hypothetical protein